MKDKPQKKKFKGDLPNIKSTEIFLNVTRLDNGEYELCIVNKNRIIKTITFKK